MTNRIRAAIADDPHGWLPATGSPTVRKRFGGSSDSLKRPPAGSASDHPPIAELMRQKFAASTGLSWRDLLSPAFPTPLAEVHSGVAPTVGFLCWALDLPSWGRGLAPVGGRRPDRLPFVRMEVNRPGPTRPEGQPVDDTSYVIGASLFLLSFLLMGLSARGLAQFARNRSRPQLMWGAGLALAAAAVLVEAVVYVGYVTTPILQLYVFLSAAIVGILSLGATRILRSPRVELGYTVYTLVTTAAVAVASFVTPMPGSMVVAGIISGNPPISLLILSSFVTVPATVVLLSASAISLRRSWRWQAVLMAAGAVVLGAGGALYIASFPVALYYAEFIGIFMLFLGIVSLPTVAPAPAPSTAGSA